MAKAKQKPSRLTIRRRIITRRRNLAKRRESPIGRLSEDGASSSRNISRRLLWLAAEWHLEAPPKIGRRLPQAVGDYCIRHRISFDWMLTGCPVDLKKMIDDRRGRQAVAAEAANVAAAYAQLTPAQQAVVTIEIRRILAERDQ